MEDFTFSALKKGEATILRVSGSHMGALIGRRGETMESLSYLASLVVNRMEGPYVKLGLDVGGYRDKREDDLTALAKRIADRVIRTGCYYEMEPMNPYERHIIHTAVADIEGVRSESKGEGPQPPRGDLFHRSQRQQPAGPGQRPECPWRPRWTWTPGWWTRTPSGRRPQWPRRTRTAPGGRKPVRRAPVQCAGPRVCRCAPGSQRPAHGTQAG